MVSQKRLLLVKRPEGRIGFNYVENGNRSIPVKRTALAKALWQRTQGKKDVKKASGTQVGKVVKNK